MRRKLPIRVVQSAAGQIIEAAAWWDANRPKAPGIFREEIARALELISTQPRVGARAECHEVKGFLHAGDGVPRPKDAISRGLARLIFMPFVPEPVMPSSQACGVSTSVEFTITSTIE